jgi:hypothetical protein
VRRILPRAADLKKQVADYIADSEKLARGSLTKAASSRAFEEIYEISLATSTVLAGLVGSRLRPVLGPARSLVLRAPLLVGIGQGAVAEAELRRFVELILWTIYFSDHPVEWRLFENATGDGFAQDQRSPISYAAHRQLRFYLDYVIELMSSEPSGLATQAGKDLEQALRKLNAAVHAGQLARGAVKAPPYDDLSETKLRSFAKLQRSTFAGCVLLLAAYRRDRFDKLNAGARAYFDWLIGTKLRKEVRGGPFGLS